MKIEYTFTAFQFGVDQMPRWFRDSYLIKENVADDPHGYERCQYTVEPHKPNRNTVMTQNLFGYTINETQYGSYIVRNNRTRCVLSLKEREFKSFFGGTIENEEKKKKPDKKKKKKKGDTKKK